MPDVSIEWRERVGRAFNTRPRIGVGRHRVWLSRKHDMDAFRDNFFNPGTHVCLDGPSGVGKTSLALTFLAREKARYVYVPLTRHTSWPDFCRMLLKPVHSSELGISTDMEVGLDRGLPTGKLRISLGSKHRPSDDVDYLTKTSAIWTEHHVVESLCSEAAALVIDDAERASEDLLTRLSDLCRLMTTRETPLCVKLCFIGTDHLFRRLLHVNPSLDQRVLQTTLGAFNDHRYSWHFLTLGFDALGLRHPGNSRVREERERLDDCIAAVYEAADGLPKSLNALGQRVATRVEERRRWVSAGEIQSASRRMTDQNWRQYSSDFPKVLRVLDEVPTARSLVRALYKRGIARVHYANDLYVEMAAEAAADGDALSEQLVRTAMERLAAVDFLVLTGRAGEVLYVAQPTAAHALGVAMRDHRRSQEMRAGLRDRSAVSGSFPAQDATDGDPLETDSP